jgi:gas vesicle protein
MELILLGCCFGAIFGFGVGLLFRSAMDSHKTRKEQEAKQRMYLTIKELEIEKIMFEMQKRELDKMNNIIPFKKRQEDDTIGE